MEKKTIWIIVAVLIVLGILVLGFWECKHQVDEAGGTNTVSLANPSAIYCLEQGFQYDIRDSSEGQFGVCILSDGSEVNAWEYFHERHNES
jgi:putative hemolysin